MLAAAGVMVVLVMAMAVGDVTIALEARSRAQTAADAAALAAAQELVLPTGASPAEAARVFAERNGGSLVSCECGPGSTEAIVEVRVAIGRLLLLGGDRWAAARARAVVGL